MDTTTCIQTLSRGQYGHSRVISCSFSRSDTLSLDGQWNLSLLIASFHHPPRFMHCVLYSKPQPTEIQISSMVRRCFLLLCLFSSKYWLDLALWRCRSLSIKDIPTLLVLDSDHLQTLILLKRVILALNDHKRVHRAVVFPSSTSTAPSSASFSRKYWQSIRTASVLA